ncbi:hypothetical protein H5410_033129, partial [Solanum commersonii]
MMWILVKFALILSSIVQEKRLSREHSVFPHMFFTSSCNRDAKDRMFKILREIAMPLAERPAQALRKLKKIWSFLSPHGVFWESQKPSTTLAMLGYDFD